MLWFTPAITKLLQPAISSQLNLKSIGKGNLHLGPSHILDWMFESVMICKSSVTI